jgi:hypothetical protein
MVVTGDSESGLDIRRLCRAGDFIEPTSGRAARVRPMQHCDDACRFSTLFS